LNFKTLYSRRDFNALFLVKVFKGKINCCSVMDTGGLHVCTKQITELFAFNVSNGSGLSLYQYLSWLQAASANF
jgi:hypothetical protein